MHATILGVAVSLLGVRVGWEVPDDLSVVYVVQLDPDDLDRFRIDRLIESDVPPQIKNVRRLRIELATLFSLPPRQDPLPKDQPPPRVPSTIPDSTKLGSPWAQPKNPGRGASNVSAWLLPPDERQQTKKKQEAAVEKSGPETHSGKPGEPPSQGAAAPRPWMPFTAAVVALCGSLGLNLYLGWMTAETRRRYRRLLQRQRSAGERTKANDE